LLGGTSVAAPVWAGIINAAGRFTKSSQAELSTIYSNLGKAADFTDIVQGSCGPNQGYLVGIGWDFCTGAGSAYGTPGK
jgi:subtilase family serine protease